MEKSLRLVRKFKWVVFVGLYFLSNTVFAEFCYHKHYIVSDFDDTIKTYHSKSLMSKLYYALWKTDINAGFATLINGMANGSIAKGEERKDCTNEMFTVLSASGKVLKSSVVELLEKNRFVNNEVILKPVGLKTFDYKLNYLYQLVTRVNNPFILIGDDTSFDPSVYRKFSLMGFDVLATYIHNVKNVSVYPDQKVYLTAFDIAVSEYSEGRLGVDVVLAVGREVLEANDDLVIPPYGYCPTDAYKKQLELPAKIAELREEIGKKISAICKKRN